MAAVDPRTGAVRAMATNAQSSFFLPWQGNRDGGSTFKVFTLIDALNHGYSPKDTINGSSCRIPVPGEADAWQPGNEEGSGATVTLDKALTASINCAFARLISVLGPESVRDTALKMGIPSDHISSADKLGPSLTLGSAGKGVSALDMASAFATIAADGIARKPYFVESISDRNGKVVFRASHEGKRVMTSQVARMATEIMTHVVQSGTGHPNAAVKGHDVAGKTGTDTEFRNAWFVGFTPQLATGVWMGDPVKLTPMTNVPGVGRVFGGTYPAKIFSSFMSAALSDVGDDPFAAPDANEVPGGRYIKTADGTAKEVAQRARAEGCAPPWSYWDQYVDGAATTTTSTTSTTLRHSRTTFSFGSNRRSRGSDCWGRGAGGRYTGSGARSPVTIVTLPPGG
jgi:penicillin-binding protein 1A